MIRVVLVNILMFALPFLLYGAYVYLTRKDEEAAGSWDDAPILWLMGAGSLLVLATMIYFVSFTGSEPGRPYHPPVLKDGKIVPGGFDAPEEKKSQKPATPR